MVRALRFGAVVAAVVTLLLLSIGDHPLEFVIADLIASAALLGAAAVPGRRGPLPWLVGAFGFATGVFTLAFARSVSAGDIAIGAGAGALACAVAVAIGARVATRTAARPT